MYVKEMGLSWIVVKNLKEALDYYTKVLGLKLIEYHEDYRWAELEGAAGGARLGIAEENLQEKVKAGQNAVLTFTVDHLQKAKAEMLKKGAICEGEILEIPGHVSLQTMLDPDGNRFQLCEVLSKKDSLCS